MDAGKFVNPDETDMPLVSRLLYQLIDEKYKTFLDESSDLMCIADRDGKFIYVNKKMADSLGYTKKEMMGLRIWDLVSQESRQGFSDMAKEIIKTGKIKMDNFILKTKLGGRITGEMVSTAFYDNLGKYCGAKSVFRDNTKLIAMEALEKKYESMLEDGIGTLDHVIIILDKNFKIRWVSSSIQKYFNLDKVAVVGESIKFIFEDKIKPLIRQADAFFNKIFSAYDGNSCVENFECLIASGNVEDYCMEYWSYPVLHGELNGGRIEIFRDITARKKSEEALEYYYKKIHAIMEHAVEGIAELRADNAIDFVNKSFLDMLGYSEAEVLNHSLSDFVMSDDRIKFTSIKLIRKAREIIFLRKDGNLLYTVTSSIPLAFGNQPAHSLCFVSDITETKMASLRLRDANMTLKALNDSLLDLSLRDVRTGLYNYRYLNERLSEEIKRAKRYSRPFSLIMIDIDFFKTVNDTYGHTYGDIILKDFTVLLRKSVRETDIVIRAGGEEFVVLLSETDASGAVIVANKIISAVENTFLGKEDRKIKLTISIGIVSYPDTDILDAEALMNAVDKAMYQSKAKGRNIVTIFNKSRQDEKDKTIIEIGDNHFEILKARLKTINLRNEEAILETMKPMVREACTRQGYDYNHVDKVLRKVEILAKSLALSSAETQYIARVAFLHNLGLLSVPVEILLKNAPLSKDEIHLIKDSVSRAVEMIYGISFLVPLEKDILSRYEYYDGTGYPKGIKGKNIPIAARIVAVVEAYEALIIARPYRKKAFSEEKALEIIEKESGKKFDPKIVEHFLKLSV